MFDLTGKAAFVTGASRGIGRSVAVSLAQAGADVALIGRDTAALEETLAAVKATGRRALALKTDVTSADSVSAAVDQAVKAYGKIDTLVCNAGVQKQLSTASKAPAWWAMSASARMSHTSVSGLVGVSANSKRVLGCTAACQAATSVCDTNVLCTPNLANSEPISLSVEPNTDCEHTTWSPALSRPKIGRAHV